jgi:hypothetical protein
LVAIKTGYLRALVYYWYSAMFSLLNDILKASVLIIITLTYPQSVAPDDPITAKVVFSEHKTAETHLQTSALTG